MAGVAGRSGGPRETSYGEDLTPRDDGPVKPPGLLERVEKQFDLLLKRLPAEALREIDSYLLAEMSTLLVGLEYLKNSWLADPADKEVRTAYMQSLEKLMQLSAKYGLTPADRKRIKLVEAQPAEDDLKEFM